MKKLFALFVLATAPCFGLLAPLQQSIREVDAIIHSKELSLYFHQNDTLQEILKDGSNYIVKTEGKQVLVEVVDVPTKRVGPKEFRLVFHPPTGRE